MPSARGWCDTCNKSDRPLISTNAKICHSCYKKQNDEEKVNKAKLSPDSGFKPVKAASAVSDPVETYLTSTDRLMTDPIVTDANMAELVANMPPGRVEALPPNWGKVPCGRCGRLMGFGDECVCEAQTPVPDTVAEWEAIRTRDEVVSLQGEPPNCKPHMSALCRLLDPDCWLLEIPREISLRLGEEGITPDDINEMLEFLLDGKLKRLV